MKKQIKELAICFLISVVMQYLLGFKLWFTLAFGCLIVLALILILLYVVGWLLKILNK